MHAALWRENQYQRVERLFQKELLDSTRGKALRHLDRPNVTPGNHEYDIVVSRATSKIFPLINFELDIQEIEIDGLRLTIYIEERKKNPRGNRAKMTVGIKGTEQMGGGSVILENIPIIVTENGITLSLESTKPERYAAKSVESDIADILKTTFGVHEWPKSYSYGGHPYY